MKVSLIASSVLKDSHKFEDTITLKNVSILLDKLSENFQNFVENGTNLEEVVSFVTQVHESVKIPIFMKENATHPSFFKDKFYFKLILDIFLNDGIPEDTKIRCIKIITLFIQNNPIAVKEFENIVNPIEFLNDLFSFDNSCFPPVCLSIFTLLSYSEYIEQMIENNFVEKSIDFLQNLLPSDVSSLDNQAITVFLLLFSIIKGLITKMDKEIVFALREPIANVSKNYLALGVENIYIPILECLSTLSQRTMNRSEEESPINLINDFDLLEGLSSLLTNEGAVKYASSIISIFYYNFPFNGDVPFDAIIALLGSSKGLSQNIIIFFSEIIVITRSVPDIFVNEEFIGKIIELAYSLSAGFLLNVSAFLIKAMQFSPMETIELFLENDELYDVIISSFESEEKETKDILIAYYSFMERVTAEGIPEESKLHKLVDELRGLISEICDSETADIQIYATTILKTFYIDEFKSRFHYDEGETIHICDLNK